MAEEEKAPYASIYNLKIHEINHSWKLPESINNKTVSLGTQTGPKYGLTSKDQNNLYTVEEKNTENILKIIYLNVEIHEGLNIIVKL